LLFRDLLFLQNRHREDNGNRVEGPGFCRQCPQEFSKFADDSFNTPEKREETRKLFATLKKNLGPLVELGEVTTGAKAFKANNQGNEQGFFISLTAKAKFEKGNGVFTVVVKNYKEQMKITSISLDPDKATPPDSNKP
jgi:hypothetical protein